VVSSGETVLVHHWMEYFRGGEAVLEQFGLLFPVAPIFMLVYNEQYLPPSLQAHPLHSSILQWVPFLRRHFRKLLPVFPEIIRSRGLPQGARFVLTSDASMIKGVPIPKGAVHVCYCHSPPRYLWGLEESYLESSSHGNPIGRMIFSASLPHLRSFDRKMAQRVDGFIANSICVQERIERCYGRSSVVINPPVEVDRFDASRPREDFFLVVSALVPYKRVDLAVDACSRLGRKLIVIGTGPEEADLRRRASACVTFLGWQSNDVVREKYETCRAFLFPGIEDFGITPCEAQAAGSPVIAFGEGGALETVREGVSGYFFKEQTVDGMAEAILRLESGPHLTPENCRSNVTHLDPARFRREIRDYLTSSFPDLFSDFEWPEGIFESNRPSA
jgi:glycosyltransferase involved in cell wall biosynthesis